MRYSGCWAGSRSAIGKVRSDGYSLYFILMTPSPDILHRMDGLIADWKERRDTRYVFLACYRLMTANMMEAIEAGRFHDREWISELLHRFAGYYFDALTCYDCGDPVPRVWQQVHRYTQERDLREVQYLLMGVNAHINYDLVLTLRDLQDADWKHLDAARRQRRYADHCTVNEVIAGSIDRVQDELLSPLDPLMGWIDRACGGLDEYLIAGLITRWREDVWKNAGALLVAEDATTRERLRQELEADVVQRGRLLAFAGWPG